MNTYNKQIIGICGIDGAGKDMAASRIAAIANCPILHFADSLKAAVTAAFPAPEAVLRVSTSGTAKDEAYTDAELSYILQAIKVSALPHGKAVSSPYAAYLYANYTTHTNWRLPTAPRVLLTESARVIQKGFGDDVFLRETQKSALTHKKCVIADFRYEHEFAWAESARIAIVVMEDPYKRAPNTYGVRPLVHVPWGKQYEDRTFAIEGLGRWWAE